MRVSFVIPALSLVLSACASTGQPERRIGAPPAKVVVRPPTPPKTPPPARVQALPGLEGVIGASAADLTRQFGTPRLDVIEGDVRKLQFSGQPCVLDVYLYPSPAAREPRATYVDARRSSDGRDVDRASCIAGLRKR